MRTFRTTSASVGQSVLERFKRYVEVYTTSAEGVDAHPSTERQMDLLKLLADELEELGLVNIDLDPAGCLYGTLPSNSELPVTPITWLAHVDTSPEQPGENVVPVLHFNWDGSPITFSDNPDLTLTVKDSPELTDHIGDTIITASGRTLLGADNKAGIAEIMAALQEFSKYPELPHGEIRVCFDCDEEIGRAVPPIDLARLTEVCYTVDGSRPGEVESECFWAKRADLVFKGNGVHPGYGFGKLVNASTAMAAFLRRLPRNELPETTKDREGFYYVHECSGGCEQARLSVLLRDFDQKVVETRAQRIKEWAAETEAEIPGLVIEVQIKDQYPNMIEYFKGHERVIEIACEATRAVGLEVRDKPIRGHRRLPAFGTGTSLSEPRRRRDDVPLAARMDRPAQHDRRDRASDHAGRALGQRGGEADRLIDGSTDLEEVSPAGRLAAMQCARQTTERFTPNRL